MPRSKNQHGPPRGQPKISPEMAIELLSEQITKANEMLTKQPVGDDAFDSWHNTTRSIVGKAFGENHPNVESFEYYWAFSNSGWTPGEWAQHRAEGLQKGIAILNGFIDELKIELRVRQHDSPTQPATASVLSNEIFIVHGHDADALNQLELILHRLQLDPFILQNTAGGGLTIIEALEKKIGLNAGAARFGIVLLTPDDIGYAQSDGPSHSKPRARQNVVLEMGMLIAALGRPNVVILKKGEVEIPSDAHGIIYAEFTAHVKEIVPKLVQRLGAAGFELSSDAIGKASV